MYRHDSGRPAGRASAPRAGGACAARIRPLRATTDIHVLRYRGGRHQDHAGNLRPRGRLGLDHRPSASGPSPSGWIGMPDAPDPPDTSESTRRRPPRHEKIRGDLVIPRPPSTGLPGEGRQGPAEVVERADGDIHPVAVLAGGDPGRVTDAEDAVPLVDLRRLEPEPAVTGAGPLGRVHPHRVRTGAGVGEDHRAVACSPGPSGSAEPQSVAGAGRRATSKSRKAGRHAFRVAPIELGRGRWALALRGA